MQLNTVHVGNCLHVLPTLPDHSVDSIVTDPPYELAFMGKAWDSTGIAYNVEVWRECLRVLKPGGHMLAFGGARTYHRMAVAIEDAGFEIRDQIMWIYGSGFPKSHNISKAIDKMAGAKREVVGKGINYEAKMKHGKWSTNEVYGGNYAHSAGPLITTPATAEALEWDGWGTALKPAHEPIVLARKPIAEGTIAENVLEHGTGGINIDDCRVPISNNDENLRHNATQTCKKTNSFLGGLGTYQQKGKGPRTDDGGRFPANAILNEQAATILNQQVGRDVARFFYCPKAHKKERTCNGTVDNKHPTVKPLELMRYLTRLVTPPNGIVLDPFAGSGTTMLACIDEGFSYIGIEQSEEYANIANKRVKCYSEVLQNAR